MLRLAALVLLIGLTLCPTLPNAQLQGPVDRDRAADVAEREQRARTPQDALNKAWSEEGAKDYYTKVHPNQPRVGDEPGITFAPDTSERSAVNPCMTVRGSRIPNCSR